MLHIIAFTLLISVEPARSVATLGVSWAESRSVVRLKFPLNQAFLTDADGNVLYPENPKAVLEIPVAPKQKSAELRIPFIGTSKTGELKFTGKCLALIASEPHSFQFENLFTKSKTQQKNEAAVTLVSVHWSETKELLRIRSRVVYKEPLDALQSFRTWVNGNPAYLLYGGERIEPSGVRPIVQSEKSAEFEFAFNVKLDEAGKNKVSFVYETATIIREEEIAVNAIFRNIDQN